MTDNTNTALPDAIGYKSNRDREMIPRNLLRGMFALAMTSLALVTFAVLTDRDPVGQPKPAEVTESRTVTLEGGGSKAVTVYDETGAVLADLAHGGFITVIQNGMSRERMKQNVAGNPPVELIRYANGRLTIHDPSTNWSVELGNFGGDNKAAFERLMSR
ncbi:photosynthetic complex assembly protein PuhC [Anianabacter salinae]|uniref:photosynthetic complex assembly protein PuhC n=1 Tax=Anianabacter salinae TaxID=2851023 RepID=UPI00225E1B79|nr:photosynthetic complex assembly protein PuhC [Anianabacter salinae]MBV0914210.1 photosynthetic complex assembly protein [Anianabacter salinae]